MLQKRSRTTFLEFTVSSSSYCYYFGTILKKKSNYSIQMLHFIRFQVLLFTAVSRRGTYYPKNFDQYLSEEMQIRTRKLFASLGIPFRRHSGMWSSSGEYFGVVQVQECNERFGIVEGNLPKFLSLQFHKIRVLVVQEVSFRGCSRYSNIVECFAKTSRRLNYFP
jgi:hypothetical protein